MESNWKTYDYQKSFDRLDFILNEADNTFEEVNEIPSRDKLSYTNGFYVNCTAMFVDVRGSSSLPAKYRRPTLAKIYRSYISEVVAVMNGDLFCAEINIVGDSVSGIFDTPKKPNIDSVFSTAARISSLIKVLNCKLKKKDIDPITVGIGISYGRALMAKAGYSGSGISDVVWMGDVVNEASNLCGYANSSYSDYEIMVSSDIHLNLKEENQKLLTYNYNRSCYHGNIINIAMEEWHQENCVPKTNTSYWY
jgi:class 3 adenylate cyclase